MLHISREEQDEFFEVGSRIKILKVGKFWSGKNQEFLKGQEFLLSRIKNFSKLILISSKNQDIWKCHSWCQAGVGTWNSGVSLRFKQEFSDISSNLYCNIPLNVLYSCWLYSWWLQIVGVEQVSGLENSQLNHN